MTKEEHYDEGMAEFAMAEYEKAIDCYRKAVELAPDYFDNPYSFTQDWTETDQTLSRQVLGYDPQYDLAKGINAYHASGKLGIS